MNKLYLWLFSAAFCAVTIFSPQQSLAIQESSKLPGDGRIRTYVYNPNEVFVFTGHYRYQSAIEFASDETIKSVTVGDSVAWNIVTSTNRIFLKPIEQDATTNMTVITDKRIYLFELHAEEADDIRDDEMVFTVRFAYPDGGGDDSGFKTFSLEDTPNIDDEPEKYNFNYTVTGSTLVAPLMAFDDGEFTFLKFKNKNADVPAIFLVDKEGNESLINYRVAGEYLVIERVSSQFTLRHGNDVACLFNEYKPLERVEVQKKKTLGIF